MNINRVYLKFTDRINMLSSNHGQSIGGLRQFVDCFNEAQYSLLIEAIQQDESTDDLQELLQVYAKSEELNGIVKSKYTSVKLPDDYEHYKGIWVDAKKGECTVSMDVQLRRLGEVSRLYNDAMNEPSIEWEESFCTLIDNTLRVYTKGFSVNVELDYYRRPIAVDIEGYTVGDTPSSNIDPELEGRNLERLIDRAARLHLRNVNDQRTKAY